jgi:CBS domain-containing protein
MTRLPDAAASTISLLEAMYLMHDNKYQHLPVVSVS